MPQDIALFEHMTVAENIKFLNHFVKSKLMSTTINEYLQQLNFDDTSAKYLHCPVEINVKLIY